MMAFTPFARLYLKMIRRDPKGEILAALRALNSYK